MGWSSWLTNSGGSQSMTKVERTSTGTKTHYLSTAGKGGSKRNHSHTIVRNSDGRTTAHSVPHKDNRKK